MAIRDSPHGKAKTAVFAEATLEQVEDEDCISFNVGITVFDLSSIYQSRSPGDDSIPHGPHPQETPNSPADLNRIIGTSLALRYRHCEIANAFAYGDWPNDRVLSDFLAYYQYSNGSALRAVLPAN